MKLLTGADPAKQKQAAPDLVDALKGYRKLNFPFLPMGRIHKFQRALTGYGGSVIAKVATQVLHYTALRTKELRSMVWANVDFENRIITIDDTVMKSRRIHVVPMSYPVVEPLTFLKKVTGQYELCFVGRTIKRSRSAKTPLWALSAGSATRDRCQTMASGISSALC